MSSLATTPRAAAHLRVMLLTRPRAMTSSDLICQWLRSFSHMFLFRRCLCSDSGSHIGQENMLIALSIDCLTASEREARVQGFNYLLLV